MGSNVFVLHTKYLHTSECAHKTFYLSGLVKCSFRCFDMPKHFWRSEPKTGSMVLSGVNHCLFSLSWRSFSLREAHSFFTTCGRETCSPFLVPMILAKAAEMSKGFCRPVSFFGSDMIVNSKPLLTGE